MESEKIPVSFVVLTQDEELNIEPCLRSFADWAGEIFIVDSGSTDRTLEIAARYTDKVVRHPFINYSLQRNWAQENLPLAFEWVFHIDADERISPKLANAVRERFNNPFQKADVSGFLVCRRIEFLGKHIRYGGIYPTYHCRLYQKALGGCEEREYDQHFLVIGQTQIIEGDLIEVTATSLFSWTARHNRWAQMEARYRTKKKEISDEKVVRPGIFRSPIEQRRWFRDSLYEKAPLFFRSFLYFFQRYVLRGGFLDGTNGLIYHFLHGFWFRFYVDACLYELRQRGTGSEGSDAAIS
jgi:glycosyltransferase involved in cell wall biosynthesis